MDSRMVGVASVLLPIGISVAWVPLRDQLPNVDVALALVLAVTACGATGRRAFVAGAAIAAAAGFAFFDTQPYERWVISRQPDLETLILLVLVSVVTGELAVRAVRLRAATGPGSHDMDRVREIAAIVASGAELVVVLTAVGDELVRLLSGSACTYDAGGSPPGALVVGRNGVPVRTAGSGGIAPTPTLGAVGKSRPTIEVPVTGMGQVLGRFRVADPSMSAMRRERLLVALTLADQAGAALIAQAPESADAPAPLPAIPLRPVLRVVD